MRYCVILYNGYSLKGIHHVSDAVLFERPLIQREKADLLSKLKENDAKILCEIKRLGYKYEDEVHIKYQLLNGVSGFLVYYYSFKTQEGLVSVVNSC